MIRVLIADDQELIRESLKIILSTNKDFEVCALAESGNTVLAKIPECKPDIILMDVRMPQMDGVACTKIVKKLYPEIKIIVLTTFDDDEYIYNAIKYGASGYLLKGLTIDELSHALYTVMEGGSIIHPKAATKVFALFSEEDSQETVLEAKGDLNDINYTEWKVIEKVSSGLSNKEIASSLHFSEGTVRNYLSAILDKLQLRDRTQLAIWYIQSGKALRKTRVRVEDES